MGDLLKRLREVAYCALPTNFNDYSLAHEAADLIEQLERELAEALLTIDTQRQNMNDMSYISTGYVEEINEVCNQLAAEKALADQLHEVAYACVSYENPARAAYRKAREGEMMSLQEAIEEVRHQDPVDIDWASDVFSAVADHRCAVAIATILNAVVMGGSEVMSYREVVSIVWDKDGKFFQVWQSSYMGDGMKHAEKVAKSIGGTFMHVGSDQ